MDLKGLLTFILQQGKYIVIGFVVFNVIKHFSKSKIAGVASGLAIGALAWFFLGNPEKVLDAIGNVLGKVFGG
ncbi:TcpD family membrane protein [Enterococcus faecium]|uniref:TcpD family membrane protein n=1 Tax=Enterococcus faecium TaxID=1352 RepID=UPI00289253EA|nr:TcpD family membrane protein [Enterococcus faecium]MCU1871634.1 TcpD family membrane protein [Enterococcus faecium]MDT2290680.1 TcpD family membrane protein [Enterococcus faecium]